MTLITIGTILAIILILTLMGFFGAILLGAWKVFGFFMDILIKGFLFLCGIGLIGLILFTIYIRLSS